ncbi:hypothetical protein D3C81_2341180 [compost metagenome]
MGQMTIGTFRLEAHPVATPVNIMPIGLHHGFHLVAGTTEALVTGRLDHLGPDQADPQRDQTQDARQQ